MRGANLNSKRSKRSFRGSSTKLLRKSRSRSGALTSASHSHLREVLKSSSLKMLVLAQLGTLSSGFSVPIAPSLPRSLGHSFQFNGFGLESKFHSPPS